MSEKTVDTHMAAAPLSMDDVRALATEILDDVAARLG